MEISTTTKEDICGIMDHNQENVLCCLYDRGTCGAYTRHRKKIDEMYDLKELANDTKGHLVRMKLLRISDACHLTEQSLIESRAGRIFLPGEKICAYHRYTLGIEWRQPDTCLHPHHQGKNAPDSRSVPLNMMKFVPTPMNSSFPIGGKVCMQHYSLISASSKQQQQQQQQQQQEEQPIPKFMLCRVCGSELQDLEHIVNSCPKVNQDGPRINILSDKEDDRKEVVARVAKFIELYTGEAKLCSEDSPLIMDSSRRPTYQW